MGDPGWIPGLINICLLRSVDYPGLSRWAKVITTVLSRRGRQRRGRKVTEIQCAAFEDEGKGTCLKKCVYPLKFEKGKETNSSIEPLEGMQPYKHPAFGLTLDF